jgi:uncharacterized membrane protein YdjX (TVP38/TMEM64 family)
LEIDMPLPATARADLPGAPAPAPLWKRLAPLCVLAAGIAAVFATGLDKYLSFEQLRQHRTELMAFVAGMHGEALVIFVLAYAASTAFSLPGGVVLTLAGGFLFGTIEGTAATVVGATAGATALFIAARSALGDTLKRKAGPWLAKLEAGFKEDAFSYLLVLRLVPAFPFFAVNLAAPILGVGLRTFVIATLFGIIPGTFVFSSIGAGLGSIFDSMEAFSLKGALTPQVLTALIGLSLLSLLPVVFKKIKARRAPSH